jgi:hypothetical protein
MVGIHYVNSKCWQYTKILRHSTARVTSGSHDDRSPCRIDSHRASNGTTRVSWTGHAAGQWNGQAHILSVMNAKVCAPQRRHARFRPLAYAALSTPRGSIRSPPERGGGVYMIRSGKRVSTGPPPGSWSRHEYVLSWNLGTPLWTAWTPYGGGGGRADPIIGVRLAHVVVLDQSWRSGLYIQGSGTLPWGSGLTVEALGSINFSGHVAALDPPMWWGQALLWTQSSRPRLGRVMAWSHTQHPYHATKR